MSKRQNSRQKKFEYQPAAAAGRKSENNQGVNMEKSSTQNGRSRPAAAAFKFFAKKI